LMQVDKETFYRAPRSHYLKTTFFVAWFGVEAILDLDGLTKSTTRKAVFSNYLVRTR